MNEKEIKALTELLKKGVNIESLKNVNETWEVDLETNSKGKPIYSFNNCCLVWENHSLFKDWTLRYNDFLRQVEINGEPINDVWRAKLRNRFEQSIGNGTRNKQVVDDFIDEYSDKYKYNPVIDYLNSVRDKKDPSIKCKDVFLKWFDVQYTNEKEKEIIERLSEKWFVSAVKRIFEPGCFIEGMIVLVGKTGVGKSTFIQRLAKGYAIEASFDIENENKSTEALNRCWICNFDEFKSLEKKEPEVVKEFLTRTSGTTRLAYRHDAEEFKRHNVFISSTNYGYILKDYTGQQERRFWVFQCNIKDKQNIVDNFTDDIVDALWADALSIYESNKNYNISISDFNDYETSIFIKLQRIFKSYMNDDAMDRIRELLNRPYKLNASGEFNSLEDFKRQINEPIANAKDTLARIPISWVNIVMQTLYRITRKNDKIAAALSDEFIYKKGMCTAGNCMIFVRKGNETLFDM